MSDFGSTWPCSGNNDDANEDDKGDRGVGEHVTKQANLATIASGLEGTQAYACDSNDSGTLSSVYLFLCIFRQLVCFLTKLS